MAEYDSSGTYQQVVTLGDTEGDSVVDITTDASNNLYVVGQFSESPDFDPGAGTETSISEGVRDAFMWSLDSDLAYRWNYVWGSASQESAVGVTISGGSTPMIYATGFFNETVVFEPDKSGVGDTSAGNQDAFAISFTSAGTYDWHTVWGNSGTDQGTAVALTSDGNLFLTGYYASTVDFDFTGDIDNHSASGTSDGFITEYYVPVSSESSSNSSSSSGSSQGPGIPGTPGCSIVPPVGAPDLFQIARTGPQATLYFSPVKNNATSYYISYGNDDATEGYGVSFPYSDTSGVISYTVNALDPAGSYSFKVRAGNGCATGLWSQVIKVGPARTRLADTTSAAPQSLLTGLALLGTSSMFLALLRQTRHD
ncbi:fibronectin type III domain-containing protein [Candidatus Woesebacteria bacterium]|nr:fibronectin type III domain-containing protein [Candidatus Woesebacteria bacterium]